MEFSWESFLFASSESIFQALIMTSIFMNILL